MTLISLLLVLTIERISNQSRYWQADMYLEKYQQLVEQRDWLGSAPSVWPLFGLIFVPSIAVFFLMQQVDSSVLTLILNTAILMVCIGCPTLRATYKCFLQAANRGDLQACSMYADQLGHEENGIQTFGQSLVWLNYRHYAAVVIWFAVFGAGGAVLYTLSRGFQAHLHAQQHPLKEQVDNLMAILDWVPVRVTALGFLLVGHFSAHCQFGCLICRILRCQPSNC